MSTIGKFMKKMMMIFVLSFLAGCSDGPRDVATKYSKIVSELSYINITKGYRSNASEKEKSETSSRTKELKSLQRELQSTTFGNQDFIGFLYLIDHTYYAESQKNGKMIDVDIGDEQLDGPRAKIKIYVSKKECDLSLIKQDEWKVQTINCPRYD